MTEVTNELARKSLDEIRARTDRIDPAELDDVWAALEPVSVEDVLGEWKGTMFETGHAALALMEGITWYGKRLHSATNAQPFVCVDSEGSLYSDTTRTGGGEASLWMIEYRGETTASMVYDALPIVDHFKRVDETTLLGVMNGKPEVVLDNGAYLYFLLEKA
ncbi:DUF4334 domain-containing protein [Lentzea sp. NPDC051838]|uniref:DUF4334 domain-containing protein n=1 Tax=Lentzea sp. NPDC051838 TaxID=3154849 RepID=UPI00341DF4D9